jgi:hypothetical protein
MRLRDRLGTVVLVYPTYRTVEFPLDFLQRAGRDAEIAQVRTVLQQIAGTARPVSAKAPNLDCSLERGAAGHKHHGQDDGETAEQQMAAGHIG